MEYVYAALILHAADKEVTEDSIKKVLKAAGATVNEARVKALIAALEGVDIDEAITKATFAPAAAVAAPAAAPAEKKGEEKKEEAKEEEKKEEEEKEEEEETGMEGLGALFG